MECGDTNQNLGTLKLVISVSSIVSHNMEALYSCQQERQREIIATETTA